MITFCAKNDLGGMEGLIGVPGTVGGALRMNAGAYGMQIGSYVREVKLYRPPVGRSKFSVATKFLRIPAHFFCPDDMMLTVILELPSKPFQSNPRRYSYLQRKTALQPAARPEKRRLHFQKPSGASAGRMIDELGLKGLSVGDARSATVMPISS